MLDLGGQVFKKRVAGRGRGIKKRRLLLLPLPAADKAFFVYVLCQRTPGANISNKGTKSPQNVC